MPILWHAWKAHVLRHLPPKLIIRDLGSRAHRAGFFYKSASAITTGRCITCFHIVHSTGHHDKRMCHPHPSINRGAGGDLFQDIWGSKKVIGTKPRNRILFNCQAIWDENWEDVVRRSWYLKFSDWWSAGTWDTTYYNLKNVGHGQFHGYLLIIRKADFM